MAAKRRAYEAQTEERRVLLEASERARFWYAVRLALVCVGGCSAGAVPMAWAVHTTDFEAAQLAWAIGPVLGTSIVLTALIVGLFRWTQDEW